MSLVVDDVLVKSVIPLQPIGHSTRNEMLTLKGISSSVEQVTTKFCGSM